MLYGATLVCVRNEDHATDLGSHTRILWMIDTKMDQVETIFQNFMIHD